MKSANSSTGRWIIGFLFAVIMAAGAAGCATSSGMTDTLSALSQVAGAAGYNHASAVLTAGAATSRAGEEITPEQEYYIGRAVAATIFSNYKPYTAPREEQYLNLICAALVKNSDKPELYNGYHVKILDSPEVNAFSTSGGHILVTRGLIACAGDEDALAAVIAHEIAHIQLQHSIRAIKTSRYSAALLQVTDAAVSLTRDSDEMADTLSDMVGDVFTELVNNGYSQSQEFEADDLALSLMAGAGYDPAAMDDMLAVMKKNKGTNTGGFYKTHPSADARIKNVNKTLAGMAFSAGTRGERTARFKAIMN